MTKILLSCNNDTLDFASDVQHEIQEKLGFKVALDVEDASDSEPLDEEFEEVMEAAVLLVFQKFYGNRFFTFCIHRQYSCRYH